jgi:hypothetical protein
VLHLRVTCPAEATDAVLDALRSNPGAVHLNVLRGAAVDPPGDLVQADVVREAADGLLSDLCVLGVDHTGGITLASLDTVLSDAADAAAVAAPGDPADAVVWDELIASTGGDSQLTFTYLAFLTLACLIAVVGVVTDSPSRWWEQWSSVRSSPRWLHWRWGWCSVGVRPATSGESRRHRSCGGARIGAAHAT